VRLAITLGVCGLAAVVWTAPSIPRPGDMQPRYTVDDRLAEYAAAVEARLAPRFRVAGLAYPPRELAFVALKDERRLEVWGRTIRLDYPNAFDRRMARFDGRTNLGGDIMIHGSVVSIGCIAIGDLAAEDVFVMSALAGIGNVRVIVAPADFRAGAAAPSGDGVPVWTRELYEAIASELSGFARQASGLPPLPQ